MLASMCKLKVGRLSREVCFISMMLIFIMSFDVSDDDDDVCDVDHHDVDVYCVHIDQGGTLVQLRNVYLMTFSYPLEN